MVIDRADFAYGLKVSMVYINKTQFTRTAVSNASDKIDRILYYLLCDESM